MAATVYWHRPCHVGVALVNCMLTGVHYWLVVSHAMPNWGTTMYVVITNTTKTAVLWILRLPSTLPFMECLEMQAVGATSLGVIWTHSEISIEWSTTMLFKPASVSGNIKVLSGSWQVFIWCYCKFFLLCSLVTDGSHWSTLWVLLLLLVYS